MHIRNIIPAVFRKYVKEQGCTLKSTKGDHEHWSKKGMNRPVTIPVRQIPLWEQVIKNGLKSLGKTKKDFIKWLRTN